MRGKELRIEKLSLDSGDVVMEGIVDRMEYEDDDQIIGRPFLPSF